MKGVDISYPTHIQIVDKGATAPGLTKKAFQDAKKGSVEIDTSFFSLRLRRVAMLSLYGLIDNRSIARGIGVAFGAKKQDRRGVIKLELSFQGGQVWVGA